MFKSWKYKNLSMLAAAIILSFFVGSFPPFKDFVFSHGLPIAFLAGIIFISTFTCPISCAMLLVMAEKYPLWEIWVVAASGAILADFIFFNLVKDHIGDEIAPIYETVIGKNHFKQVMDTKHFRWLFPIIGAGIILSPLPKTMGLNMLGIHKLKRLEFVAISALVNAVGIAFILLLSFAFKP